MIQSVSKFQPAKVDSVCICAVVLPEPPAEVDWPEVVVFQ